MTAERRALLGDHEASKRLSEAGVLLPCMVAEKPELFVLKSAEPRLEIWDIWHQLNAGIAGWN